MAWFGIGRRRAELAELREALQQRAIGGVPWIDNNPAIPFGSGGPAHPSAVATNPEAALRLSPIYASARVLADGVASLPLQVYIGANSQTVATRWNGPSIFDKPSAFPQTTLYDWLHTAMTSLVLEGNAFGYIATRDGMGFPTTIEWLSPSQVYIDEGDRNDLPNPLNATYYYSGREVNTEDLLHIRAFTLPGQVRGISPMRAFATIVSQGNAMAQYGHDWFSNGGFPPGIFKNVNMEIDPDQAEDIKLGLARSLRSRRPLVIGADWDYTAVKVPPSESQFVDAVRMNATQIAAIYGVPPERVGGTRGDSLTYANQEQASISFITDTLRPWLVRLENAFFGILPAKRYVRFNADAMVKTDLKTRHEVFTMDRSAGFKTTDEIRAIDDLEPMANGLGADTLPLTIAGDLTRSGKAIPSLYKDEITVLQVAPGATPGTPASDTTETPQADESSTTGQPDPKTLAGSNGSNGNGKAQPKPAPSAAVGKGGTISVGRSRRDDQLTPPKRAPKRRGLRVRSVDDVARVWYSPGAPRAITAPQAFRAEAGMHARRGGVEFRGYDERSLTEEQYDWLLSMCRASEKPLEYGIIGVNGRQPAETG